MAAQTVNTMCPLCNHGASLFHEDRRRPYLQCECCELVFVPPAYHLASAEEKKHYDLHENSPNDPRYRAFLNRLFQPISERLQPGSKGLDFGSGPGPTLAVMFSEAGHNVEIFDPFYANNPAILLERYDFITASEVIEHVYHPRRDLELLWDALLPGGFLGIMTKRVKDRNAFAGWHYKEDPTHVCFFSEATFRWLARHWGATFDVCGTDVVIFQKPPNIG